MIILIIQSNFIIDYQYIKLCYDLLFSIMLWSKMSSLGELSEIDECETMSSVNGCDIHGDAGAEMSQSRRQSMMSMTSLGPSLRLRWPGGKRIHTHEDIDNQARALI